MKTKLFLLLAVLAGVSFSGCFVDLDDDGPFNCTRGTGSVVTETLNVPDFDGIVLKISADVEITQGPTQLVEVEGFGNIIDELETDVRAGVWEIEFDDCIRNQGNLRIFITVPNLRMLKVSGSGDVVSTNTLDVPNLELGISGSGTIDVAANADNIDALISGSGSILLEGAADELDLRTSGSGDLRAFDLPVREANVEISGSGNADVTVADYLRVRISGSGDVRYRGNPTLDVNISGSGRVVDAN